MTLKNLKTVQYALALLGLGVVDAPSSLDDLTLDDIFPAEPGPGTPQTSPTPAPPPPTVEEPFLKTATGTVYKTADEAKNGIEHKDALIKKLRQETIDRTGVDPVTGQRVPTNPVPESYLQNGRKFIEDLQAAANSGDANKYVEISTRPALEAMAPYLPMISELAKRNAIEGVASENPQFREFYGSDHYKETLGSYPALAEAISQAEANPAMAPNLSQFYKMVYGLDASRRLPEVVRQGATPTRPTLSSAPPSPPPVNVTTAAPDMYTTEGRKALIAEQEKAGVGNIRF